MGRYPNGDASYPYFPNFYKFQSSTGTGDGASSITSSSLSGDTDWTGADVVIRINQWTLNNSPITSQGSSTLNFLGKSEGGLTANWGFFIQNDIRTLDQQNEWYYNPSTKKISIYSIGVPTDIQVSTVDTLFHLYSNIPAVNSTNIENIDFTGANTHAILISGYLIFSVTNCNISYTGLEGLMLRGRIQSGTINNNTFYNCGSSSISARDVTNLTIKNNRLTMSGVISVYKANDYSNGGLLIHSPNTLIQYNTIDSSAYSGIEFNGGNTQIRNNFINHSALVRGDAAGIYTGYVNAPGKVIDGNIILNSAGNPRGSGGDDYFAFGIYSDDLGNHIAITNNTVGNCRTGGILIHNSNNLKVRNNTIYNCGSLKGEKMWDNGGIAIDGNARRFTGNVHDNCLFNNIIFTVTPYQYALSYYAENGSNDDISHFGTLDSNYYVKINTLSTLIYSNQPGINGVMGLSQWQSLSGQDSHSQESPKEITSPDSLLFIYNATSSNSSISLDARYIDVKGNVYDGNITLSPFSSAVLILVGAAVVTVH